MTTIPVLDPVTDINDSDLVMVTNAQGFSYTINGAELEKRNKIIIASNTTVTGVPLKAGRVVRIYFDTDITANDGNTVMQINYNSVNYYVKVPKDGALSNFVAHAVGNTYKYVQAHTTLEFLVVGNQQNGFQFVIIGNPVVISTSDYTIYADGHSEYTSNVAVRQYLYTNYLKITFNTFIPSSLGSVNILFGGRGSTGLIVIGSGSYADFNVAKNFTNLAEYLIPNVYIKDRQSNYPIYIDTGGGLKANAIIMAQNVIIASIEPVDTIPSDYIAY